MKSHASSRWAIYGSSRVAAIAFASLLVGSPSIATLVSGGPPLLPTAHPTDPSFAMFDAAMERFMTRHGISAGTFALSDSSHVLYSQGFGTMSPQNPAVVPADALLRLASVSKPVTLALLYRLASEHRLNYSDYAYCLGQAGTCHLRYSLPPNVTTYDPRLREVTIQMLVDHTGGWDASLSGDPMRRSIQISADLGIAGPANASDVARWMLGQRLDHDPGTVQVYSNFGYVLLGLILEQTTGVYLVHELRAEIFNATNTGSPGPAPDEIILGHSLPALRDPREPSYNCDGGWTAPSVYAPHNPVCWADGGWFVESGLSAGGLVASAPTLAWFLEHYWLNDGSPRSSITDPRDPDNYFNGGDWLFEGSMEGTRTFVSQHCSGYNYVALFNQRYDAAHGYDYDDAPRLLDEATTAYSLAHPLYPLPYASVLPVGTFGFLLGPGNVAPICTAQLTIDDLSAGLPADLTP